MPKLIRALTPDLISVLQGRTVSFGTDDDEEILIRLMTADEYEAWLREITGGPDGPPMPPRHRIEELTRRLPGNL